jgi:hypothetical protein
MPVVRDVPQVPPSGEQPGGQDGNFKPGTPINAGLAPTVVASRAIAGRTYQGIHEPLIDRATWERVQEILDFEIKKKRYV